MKHKCDFWKVCSLPGTPRCMIISGLMRIRAVDGKKYETLFVVAALVMAAFHVVCESMCLYLLAVSNVSRHYVSITAYRCCTILRSLWAVPTKPLLSRWYSRLVPCMGWLVVSRTHNRQLQAEGFSHKRAQNTHRRMRRATLDRRSWRRRKRGNKPRKRGN